MGHKLGACTYSWLYDCPLEAALERIAELGFRYVELIATPPHLLAREMDAGARRRLCQTIHSLGLEVVSLNPTFLDLNLASNNPAYRRLAVEELGLVIDLAAELEARFIVVGPGRRHALMPAPAQQARHWAFEGMARLVERCRERGVMFGLENTPNGFLEGTQDLKRLRHDLGVEQVRIVFDVANVTAENPAVAIEELGSAIGLVHLSDTPASGPWGHLPVGMGDVDFPPVAHALEGIGYEGVSILELTYPAAPSGATANSARRLEALGWTRLVGRAPQYAGGA